MSLLTKDAGETDSLDENMNAVFNTSGSGLGAQRSAEQLRHVRSARSHAASPKFPHISLFSLFSLPSFCDMIDKAQVREG